MNRPRRALLFLFVVLLVPLAAFPTLATGQRYRHLDLNLTSEADYDNSQELPTSDGIGVDIAVLWTNPGGMIGRDDTGLLPLAIGYTVGAYGGYVEPLAPGPDNDALGWTIAIGDLHALSIVQAGARLGVTFGNADRWQDEWLRVDLTADIGAAVIETETREAVDVISITHKMFVVLSPGVAVHTPIRWRSRGDWPSLDLMAGTSMPLYMGSQDLLSAVRMTVGLGLVFGQ